MDRDNIGEVPKLSNLLKNVSTSEELQLVSSEENMSQEEINALSIADDISNLLMKIKWKTC